MRSRKRLESESEESVEKPVKNVTKLLKGRPGLRDTQVRNTNTPLSCLQEVQEAVKVMLENPLLNKYIICFLFRFILKLCQFPEVFFQRNIWWKISQFILKCCCCCPHVEPALPVPRVRDIEVVLVSICIMVLKNIH